MMKKISFVLLALLGFVLGSCGSDDENSTPNGLSHDERPSSWIAVVDSIDLQSSMTADVAIDLSSVGLQYEADSRDLVAAFVGGTCRAVASASATESPVFLLTIKKLTTDASGESVTLKYYSATYQHIFTSQPFAYQADGILGTISNPYKPEWKQ